MSGPSLTHWTDSPSGGDMREFPIGEVPGAVLDLLRPLVAGARAGTEFSVPGFDGWRCSLVESAGGSALFGHIGRTDGPPLAYVAVGRNDDPESAEAWAWCSRRGLGDALDSRRPPSAPWLVSTLSFHAVGEMEAIRWLGDFERCVAWAWIESRGRWEIRAGGNPPPPWRAVSPVRVLAALKERYGADTETVVSALVRAGDGATADLCGGAVVRLVIRRAGSPFREPVE